MRICILPKPAAPRPTVTARAEERSSELYVLCRCAVSRVKPSASSSRLLMPHPVSELGSIVCTRLLCSQGPLHHLRLRDLPACGQWGPAAKPRQADHVSYVTVSGLGVRFSQTLSHIPTDIVQPCCQQWYIGGKQHSIAKSADQNQVPPMRS